ncbi:hypothetical protein KUTeg_003442 [Tegillarca granosa]|uniref:EF-hand domain-containing protein n=1 Tax=Tegillarca granosa TaxID=220873 RepID=A0ABQ9FM37_TEGGR|nr:hypothetical protein KUTeg_003442 [Tegillarca granosa]
MVEQTADFLICALREEVLHRGCGGIKGLGLVFKNMDIDYSRRIVYDELKEGLLLFGIRMSERYLVTLFKALDTDRSGEIDFLEFMKALRPPMNKNRIRVINEVYDKMDVNSDGVLNTEDLKGLLYYYFLFILILFTNDKWHC